MGGGYMTMGVSNLPPITFTNFATLHPLTKTIEYHKDYSPDAVAKVFWEHLCHPPYEVIKSLYSKEIEQDHRKWLSILSAPKDRKILLRLHNGISIEGEWDPIRQWWTTAYFEPYESPTHWMPRFADPTT